MKIWAAILIPAAIIMVLLGYALGSRTVPQSALDNLANAAVASSGDGLPDENVAVLPDASTENIATPLPYAAASPADPDNVTASAPADTGAPALSDRPPPDDATERSDPDAGGPPNAADAQVERDIARAIRAATLDALNGGAPVHWHKDGLQGDVAVSTASRSSGGTCRTVTATMGTPDRQQQSRDHVWCQADDDSDWIPR